MREAGPPLVVPQIAFGLENPTGWVKLNTVLRAAGFLIMIYSDDHPPPHVHVIGKDAQMKVLIEGTDGRPVVMNSSGLKFGDARRVLRTIAANKDVLLAEWRKLHG